MTSRRHQVQLTAPTPIADDHWTAQAKCLGEDPEIFFVDGDHRGWGNPNRTAQREYLRTICAGCPVMLQCRMDAVREDDGHAFRGGMTPGERSEWAAKLRQQAS